MASDEARNRGNALFGEKKYLEALEAYAEGLTADPTDHKCHANRSACYAELAGAEWRPHKKVLLWHSALKEATACVNLDTGRTWPKAYVRKATAEFNLIAELKQWRERKIDDEKWVKTQKKMQELDDDVVDLGVAGEAVTTTEADAAQETSNDATKASDADAEDDDKGGTTVPPSVVKSADAVTHAVVEATCRAGLAIEPTSTQLLERLQALRDEGYQTDVEADRKLVNVEQAEACKKDGNAEFVAKRYHQAAEIYTRALAQDPFSHVLLSNRSACYAAEDECEKALRDAEACVTLNPDFVKGYSRKATALYLLGRYTECEATAKVGLAMDPDNAPLKETLAKAQVDSNESPEFQRHIHELRKKQRQDAKMQALLAKLNLGGNVKMFGGGGNGMADLQSMFAGGGSGGGAPGGFGGGGAQMSEAQMRQMAHAMASATSSDTTTK